MVRASLSLATVLIGAVSFACPVRSAQSEDDKPRQGAGISRRRAMPRRKRYSIAACCISISGSRVPRVAKNVRGHALKGRDPRMQHCSLLGYRRLACCGIRIPRRRRRISRKVPRRCRQGESGWLQDGARAGLRRCAGGDVQGLRQAGSSYLKRRGALRQGDGSAGATLVRTTTRHRSIMRSRSTRRPLRPTRPMPIELKGAAILEADRPAAAAA